MSMSVPGNFSRIELMPVPPLPNTIGIRYSSRISMHAASNIYCSISAWICTMAAFTLLYVPLILMGTTFSVFLVVSSTALIRTPRNLVRIRRVFPPLPNRQLSHKYLSSCSSSSTSLFAKMISFSRRTASVTPARRPLTSTSSDSLDTLMCTSHSSSMFRSTFCLPSESTIASPFSPNSLSSDGIAAVVDRLENSTGRIFGSPLMSISALQAFLWMSSSSDLAACTAARNPERRTMAAAC
mmetsp:Transcript_28662/g.39414  ORF Transcript_28662/g.39414 Transcript_28662/m.39414 type:complete len:240 (-) Transcript_28662:585-1304(-)